LIYLRDKALLFDEARDGFVMYAVKRRTWIALGDPIGPPSRIGELIRLFIERCDDFGGTPVFYEVGKQHLHRYADFGLAFVKLGEKRASISRSFPSTARRARGSARSFAGWPKTAAPSA
jgi:phosphatidylglycerol lysyltransferase